MPRPEMPTAGGVPRRPPEHITGRCVCASLRGSGGDDRTIYGVPGGSVAVSKLRIWLFTQPSSLPHRGYASDDFLAPTTQ